jgi:SAM-dependent methyltransferase
VTDSDASWVPPEVNPTVPNPARIYDYALGGVHNLEPDRELWDRMERIAPDARVVARTNRQFLIRVVRWLVAHGVSQFLDIGSGIPTLGNVHEAAQEADPRARVVYVDNDPVAVQQSRSLLRGNENALAVQGDLLDPEQILFHPEIVEFLDFSQPVAVLIVAVLHFVEDEHEPAAIVSRIATALSGGSFLVVSHVGPDPTPEGRERQRQAQKLYEQTSTPLVIRDAQQLRAFFDDDVFELLEPGVVPAEQWHPDPDEDDDLPPQSIVLAAVARRR